MIDRIVAAAVNTPCSSASTADVPIDEVGVGMSEPTPEEPYQIPLLVPQFLTERRLRERLAELGHAPHYSHDQRGDRQGLQVREEPGRPEEGPERGTGPVPPAPTALLAQGLTAHSFLAHPGRHPQPMVGVWFAIARDPAARLRDIAALCRITERTAQSIVTDLEQAGCLRREREGRRTRYILCLDGTLRHPAEVHVPVRHLLDVFTSHDDRP
ncbi:hypothetical protein ABZZ74_37675 [Streptomyces sp. NPDC006476]|uniref:hypothetical protein n=1 Tax=Streptomyces sp. NPDC006476 TaxID=3157175 RepID=UPI0033B30CFD